LRLLLNGMRPESLNHRCLAPWFWATLFGSSRDLPSPQAAWFVSSNGGGPAPTLQSYLAQQPREATPTSMRPVLRPVSWGLWWWRGEGTSCCPCAVDFGRSAALFHPTWCAALANAFYRPGLEGLRSGSINARFSAVALCPDPDRFEMQPCRAAEFARAQARWSGSPSRFLARTSLITCQRCLRDPVRWFRVTCCMKLALLGRRDPLIFTSGSLW